MPEIDDRHDGDIEAAGGGWLVNDRKHFITGADGAGLFIIMARTSGEPGDGIVKLLACPSLCDDRRSWPLQRRTKDSGIRARSSPTVCGSTTASR
ncbi:hypothetical protein EEB14_52210 [Rhodococcus sp. WS4]|nr:hypothetical protein EEB14_52210 [Rhodococcus sp. WS4]